MPSKLEQLQQQYRRQLLQEKEERLIKIHTESQQKALSKVSRYHHNNGNGLSHQQQYPPHHSSPVKKGSPGVDRSRPLPPISRQESGASNHSNYRTSPVSAPAVADGGKMATGGGNSTTTRSKSVDLAVDYTNSTSTSTSSRIGVATTRPAAQSHLRNGYNSNSKAPSPPRQSSVEQEKPRPDPEMITKMRQAELQRLRAKIRDETPPRSNGFTGAISKSSNNVPKKTSPAKPQPTAAAAPSRARPSYQTTTSTVAPQSRRPQQAPAASKPAAARGAAASRGGAQGRNAPAARKPPGPGQEQCRVCGRNFNADRIEKHVSICSKASQKKVKVFDATKMRVQGTEAEQFVKKGPPRAEPKAKKADWRKQHNEFIEAIRQAKMVQQHLAKGGKVSDLPPPPPSDTSDYVPCPYCGRKFSEGVADRHIPKCKNILSNKKNPVAPPRRK